MTDVSSILTNLTKALDYIEIPLITMTVIFIYIELRRARRALEAILNLSTPLVPPEDDSNE